MGTSVDSERAPHPFLSPASRQSSTFLLCAQPPVLPDPFQAFTLQTLTLPSRWQRLTVLERHAAPSMLFCDFAHIPLQRRKCWMHFCPCSRPHAPSYRTLLPVTFFLSCAFSLFLPISFSSGFKSHILRK